jgi:hypothetical protein
MLLVVGSLAATAQTGFTVSGTLLSADKTPMGRAEARLLNKAGQVVKTATVAQGRFVLEGIAPGEYSLVFWAEGKETLTLTLTVSDNRHLSLQMADRSVLKLEEVTVKSVAKAITYNNGNTKIEVANSVLKASPSPIDLLAKLPNVLLSPNREALAVAGRGNAIVYLGNQRISLADLQSLSMDDIKSVEIIPNPPARYEAEGRAVILITRKTKKKEGHEWLFSETVSFKRYFNNYNSVQYSAKKRQTEYRANLAFNPVNVWESNGVEASIPSKGIESEFLVVAPTNRQQWLMGGSLYRQLGEDEYWSLSANGRIQNDRFTINTNTQHLQAGAASQLATFSNNKSYRDFINSMLNLQRKIKPWKSQLFGGLQYGYYTQGIHTRLYNNVNNGGFTLDNLLGQGFGLHNLSARTDMETAFRRWKLETGLLWVQTYTNTSFVNNTVATGNTLDERYRLRESNAGLYAQGSGQIKKLRYMAGARLEHTLIDGRLSGPVGNRLHRQFLNFFPKLQAEWQLDSLSSLTVNYARSIARPSFGSTGVGVAYINPYFVFATNLNLQPTLNNEASIAWRRKGRSVTLRVYRNTNPVNYSLSYNDGQGYIEFKPNNFDKETGANIDVSLPFTLGKWNSTNNFSGIYNKISDRGAQLGKTRPYLYFYTNQSLHFPKAALTLAYSAWGLSPRYEGSFERNGLVVMNMDISKKWGGRIDTVFTFNDIFRQATYRDAFTSANIKARDVFYTDTREFAVAIKYQLGRLKDAAFRQKAVNENLNRLN